MTPPPLTALREYSVKMHAQLQEVRTAAAGYHVPPLPPPPPSPSIKAFMHGCANGLLQIVCVSVRLDSVLP